MNCYNCIETQLTWGGDHDLDKEDSEDYDMETNLSCPDCNATVLVYWSTGKIRKDNNKYNVGLGQH